VNWRSFVTRFLFRGEQTVKLFRHRAVIRCHAGYFPVDMLRYSAAYPASEADSHKIERLMLATSVDPADQLVTIERMSTTRLDAWNRDHFRSFNVTVANTDVERVDA
jgi:hypothetical protein